MLVQVAPPARHAKLRLDSFGVRRVMKNEEIVNDCFCGNYGMNCDSLVSLV